MSSHAYSLFERHDGLSFAYKVLGRNQHATPLVMVHGLSAVGLIDWMPLAASIAKHRPVLIFDNRGIGSSYIPKEKAGDTYDVHDMANDVVELVKHVGWREIDLLGFSMGGMIAQTVLVTPRLPFKIRHVVLAATSAKPAHSDLLQAIPQPPGGELTYEDKVKLVTPFVYVGYDPKFVQDPKNKEILDRRVRESVESRRPARTVQNQVGVIAGYDVRKQLSSVPSTLPVLVFHGTLDRSVYFTESSYIRKGIPHAQFLSLDGVGHIMRAGTTTSPSTGGPTS
ncbi:alpha/beta hydrolase [Rhodotorula toruloides NP11]|uniref:Alpha/beta hydrolase n=1 Tax=Rhodotorula toruloides (strain NP11) TaxID=1130832 RepID=M7XZ28_RHOT1|nr:alpha/beta hydrolase [Rhodotorula toruloides NP11]EMS25568.1 alpha/beta hydrolase [Rhodotorula toruloides NP11]